MVTVHSFASELLGEERNVYVFTPPGLDPGDTAPVLIMQDGQNLFSGFGDGPGEWQIEDVAAGLMEDGDVMPVFIVGVANAPSRDEDYTPTVDPDEESGGGAEMYLDFVIGELLPWLAENFSVDPDPEFTGIGGSSLGGLFSLYAGFRRPDVFGRIAAISPSIWWDDHVILDFVGESDAGPDNLKIWLDMGHYEDEGDEDVAEGLALHPVIESRALCDLLKDKGFRRGRELRYFEDRQGTHDEESWGHRFGRVLKFLYPAGGTT